MIGQLNNIAEIWWAWMWPMFWQVGVLVALIWLVDLVIRAKVWPQVRYALWLLVLVKLVLPPTFSLSTSVTSQLPPLVEGAIKQQEGIKEIETVSYMGEGSMAFEPSFDRTVEPIVVPRESTSSDAVELSAVTSAGVLTAEAEGERLSWRVYVVGAWLVGAVILAVLLMARFRQLRQAHRGRKGRADVPEWLSELLVDTAKRLNLRRTPEVALSGSVTSPAVFGVLRPVLLLPKENIAGFSRKDFEHVLLHELAHLKRGDLWVHSIYMVLQIVYWFNPLLWIVRRQLQHLRELCCDATVAGILREKTVDYRETIVETARRLLDRPIGPGMGLLGLFEDSSRLLVRLKWLEKKTWKYRALRIVTIFTVVALMFACVLPMAKARHVATASEPDEKTDVKVEGEARVSKLLTALQNEKYVHIREPIIQMVEEIGDKEPISFLVEQLQSENRARRCDAALALELLGDRRGVPAIIKELNDSSYRPTTRIRSDAREDQEGQVRQDHYYAALLLGILGDERAVPALIEATADEKIHYLVAMSLGQIGDKRAVPALRDMLDKNLNKPFQRVFTGYGLAMLGDEEGLEVVIDTLNDQRVQWSIRRHAIVLLGKLADKQAVPHLIVALKDDHPNIRVSAARALGAIGDASALPALEEALKDNTETKVNAPTTVSKTAAEAIAQIKTGDGQKSDVREATARRAIAERHERRIEFFGLDLTDAPCTTKWADLPDLFEARPPGSKSYHMRKDVTVVHSELDGTVYYIPEKNIFYVQHDLLGASTLHYYGPFKGDPREVFRPLYGTVTGTVRFHGTGAPAAGVVVKTVSKWFDTVQARTDQQGSYTLAGIRPEAVFHISAEDEQKELFVADMPAAVLKPGEAKTGVDLTLYQGRKGSISGKVVSRRVFYKKPERLTRNIVPENFERRQDSPLSGVKIVLKSNTGVFKETITDETGRYRFEGLHADGYVVRAEQPAGVVAETVRTLPMAGPGRAEGHGSSQSRWVELKSEPKTDIDFHFRLDWVSISGRVTDAEGNPVSGVKVGAELCSPKMDGGEGRSGAFSTIKISWGSVSMISGEDGRYRLDGLCPVTFSETATYLIHGKLYRRYEVRIQAKGYSPARVLVPPVTEHLVGETSRLMEDYKGLYGERDSSSAEVALPKSRGNAVTGIDFVLQKAAVITGRVLDTEGNVVPGPGTKALVRMVFADSRDDKSEKLLVQIPGRTGLDWIILDEAGHFKFSGVGAGSYFFEIRTRIDPHDTQRARNEPLAVKAGEVIKDLDVIVKPAKERGKISGRVLDALSGKPIAAFSAKVTRVDSSGVGTPVLGRTTIDKTQEGAFLIEDISAGTATLEVSAPGYAREKVQVKVVSGQTTDMTFNLEQGGKLQVYVTLNGKGQMAWVVSARPAGEGLDAEISTQMGKDGRYELTGLKEAEYLVRAPVPLGTGIRGRATVQINNRARVKIEPGKEKRLDFKLRDNAGIRGTFTGPDKDLSWRILVFDDSAAVRDDSVSEVRRAHALIWKLEQGKHYEIRCLPAGTYRVVGRCCKKDEGWTAVMEKSKTVTVGAGQVAEVDFVFP